MPQVSLYISGVGSIPSKVQKATQGATGQGTSKPSLTVPPLINQGTNVTYCTGVNHNVQTAWAWLSDNWLPGDEICLFGFSCGAFTARALAGLINWGGILAKAQATHLKPIWSAYAQRRPDKTHTLVEAAQTLYRLTGKWPNPHALDTNHVAAIVHHGSQTGSVSKDETMLKLKPYVHPPSIKVVGVWDTVGALGVPGQFPNRLVKGHYSFDPGLSQNVEYAFHALALDEQRKDFLPTLFYQSDDAPPTQILQQMWFQGSHYDVGGGYNDHGLSDITLAWMVAHLRDNKQGSLLHLDLKRLGALQDQRWAWARQLPHDPKLLIEARAVRRVYASHLGLDKLVGPQWSDMVHKSKRNESLHHSVVVGQRLNPFTSDQFDWLRRHGQSTLIKLWHHATKPSSLLPTEVELRWKGGTIPREMKGSKLSSPQYEPTSLPCTTSKTGKAHHRRRWASLDALPTRFTSTSPASLPLCSKQPASSTTAPVSHLNSTTPPPCPKQPVSSAPVPLSHRTPTTPPPCPKLPASSIPARPATSTTKVPSPCGLTSRRTKCDTGGITAHTGSVLPPAPTGVPAPISELEYDRSSHSASRSRHPTGTLVPVSRANSSKGKQVNKDGTDRWTFSLRKPSKSARGKGQKPTDAAS